MIHPKKTYTISSTLGDCDFARIVKENNTSEAIVLSRKGLPNVTFDLPTITLVTTYAARQRLQMAGIDACAYPPGNGYTVYAGDVHRIALGLVETKVEVY